LRGGIADAFWPDRSAASLSLVILRLDRRIGCCRHVVREWKQRLAKPAQRQTTHHHARR